MIRPLLSLKWLSFDEGTGKISYEYGKDRANEERMDYLEFIASNLDKKVEEITTSSPEAYKYFTEGKACLIKQRKFLKNISVIIQMML